MDHRWGPRGEIVAFYGVVIAANDPRSRVPDTASGSHPAGWDLSLNIRTRREARTRSRPAGG
jgi:hypothetical protein